MNQKKNTLNSGGDVNIHINQGNSQKKNNKKSKKTKSKKKKEKLKRDRFTNHTCCHCASR